MRIFTHQRQYMDFDNVPAMNVDADGLMCDEETAEQAD